MSSKFQPRIGEVFKFHDVYGGVTPLETIEGGCFDCDLRATHLCGSYYLLCLPDERSDKKHVAFKRIVEWN